MTGRFAILWNESVVGYIVEMKVDMFHVYGRWEPSNEFVTQQFLRAVEEGLSDIEVRIQGPQGPILGYVNAVPDDEIEMIMYPS